MEFFNFSSLTNFDVKFTRVTAAPNESEVHLGTKNFTGAAHLELGKNLAGNCANIGFCGWSLRSGNTPLKIQQNEA